MKKIALVIVLLLTGLNSIAQDSLTVKIEPMKDYSFLVLYKLKDVKQSYINNTKPNEKGQFVFDMSKQTPGVYMLMYDADPKHFVYFIYNHEPVSLIIYPNKNNQMDLLKSKENAVYLSYVVNSNFLLTELYKIEKKLSKEKLSKEDIAKYEQLTKELDTIQTQHEKQSEGLMAHKYIYNMYEYFPNKIRDKDRYFAEKKAHFFDRLDFNDTDLMHSNTIISKINQYVFNLDTPVLPKTKHLEFVKRIEEILPKIKDENYKNNVIMSLTTSFVSTDGRVSKILINKYIKKMPPKYQAEINIANILREIGLLIGEKAPDFIFKDIHKEYKFYDITKTKKYTLLIFWSSTCPHCLRAMPKIQKAMKGRKDFNIVAIGLESAQSPWVDEHQYYPEFIHGIKLEKWDNPIVDTYQLQSTPSFFIVNDKNEIIGTPYEVSDLKKILLTLK